MAIVTIEDSTTVELPPAAPKEMISVTTDEATGKTRVKINYSSLVVIQECSRKAQYSLKEGWKSMVQSPPLIFGSGIHKAIEIFSSAEPEERVLPPYEHVEMMAYGHKPPPTNNDLVYRAIAGFLDVTKPLAALPETDKRSPQNGAYILYNYFKTYANDPYIIYRDKDGPFTERGFTFRLYEDPTLIVDYFGTIDAVKQHRITKEIMCVDYKTTSMISGYGDSGSFLEKDKPNSQYTGYLLGLREAFGINTSDFCVEIIEVKAKPKTARGSPPQFPRQITTRDENDFAEFRESVMKYVRDYLYMTSTGVWPIGPVSSCNLWGACPYKQVCASPKEIRETILTNKFSR